MRLRAILTLAMAAVGGVAVAVAIVLIAMTSAMSQAGLALDRSLERVRLLMDLEAYALQSLQDPGAPADPPQEIISRLEAVADAEARPDVERLGPLIETAIRAPTREGRQSAFGAATRALRGVVAREDRLAEDALARTASWSRAATSIGIAAVIVLLAGVGLSLGWLWHRAFEPVVAVVGAIEALAAGDEAARAPETGPGEIQQIGQAFNRMAAALGRQREQQLAFVGGVAHDLRNPLNAMQAAVSLLSQPDADAARVADRLRRHIDRLESMVGDLMDRTRVEAGQFELHLDTADLREIVQRAVEAQRAAAPNRRFVCDLPPDPLPARCDPLRVEQVLANLLSNAVKYSPESTPVVVVLAGEPPWARLSVADSGIGISPVDVSRLFEPFARGANVGRIGGAGLGLSVADKLVRAHGGRIDVQSEPGRGSVFTVRLPLAS